MFMGYYFDISVFYGDFRSEIIANMNKPINPGGDGSSEALTVLNDSFANWLVPGRTFVFAPAVSPLDTTITTACLATIDVAAPYWDTVTHIYLDEMSNLDRAGLEAFLVDFRAALTIRGLAQKLIIVNFPPEVILAGPGRWQAIGIDVVGFNCYLQLEQQNDDVATLISDQIDSVFAFTGPRPVIFTLQSYNTLGGSPLRWTNMDTLKLMQTTPYLKARNDARVVGLFPFNYGRDAVEVNARSARTLPVCIKNELFRIYGAISGTAQPDDITCHDIPALTYFTQDLTCNMFCKELTCIIPASLSGMYRLVPGKTHDTLYTTITTPTQFTTIDVAIPNPFIETAPLGE